MLGVRQSAVAASLPRLRAGWLGERLRAVRSRPAAPATADPLTGLPNRRALVAAIDAELERCDRYGRSCGLLFLGIDQFQQLDDTYGRTAGDLVLKELARLVHTSLRPIDTVGRWGGEAFVILLPEADGVEAIASAECLRCAVADHVFGDVGGLQLTCSIGAAVYPADAPRRSELLDAADHAVSAARRLGRNLSFAVSDPAVVAAWAEATAPGRAAAEAASAAAVDDPAMLIEARDSYTGEHGSNVSDLALRLALALDCDSEDLRAIAAGGRLHDVGKVAVPDAVLQKAGELTLDEWEVMRGHPVLGADIVGRIPALRRAAELICAHHEWWDGTGYPARLTGTEIPLGARVLAVADSYYAITTGRAYQLPRDHEVAMAEIVRCRGTQFDPAVVGALQQLSHASSPL